MRWCGWRRASNGGELLLVALLSSCHSGTVDDIDAAVYRDAGAESDAADVETPPDVADVGTRLPDCSPSTHDTAAPLADALIGTWEWVPGSIDETFTTLASFDADGTHFMVPPALCEAENSGVWATWEVDEEDLLVLHRRSNTFRYRLVERTAEQLHFARDPQEFPYQVLDLTRVECETTCREYHPQ